MVNETIPTSEKTRTFLAFLTILSTTHITYLAVIHAGVVTLHVPVHMIEHSKFVITVRFCSLQLFAVVSIVV